MSIVHIGATTDEIIVKDDKFTAQSTQTACWRIIQIIANSTTTTTLKVWLGDTITDEHLQYHSYMLLLAMYVRGNYKHHGYGSAADLWIFTRKSQR